jgi:hypothetical protein
MRKRFEEREKQGIAPLNLKNICPANGEETP